MNQSKKLAALKKAGPICYDVTLALICMYVAWHIRSFLNFFASFETGYIIGVGMVMYYTLNLLLVNHKIFPKERGLVYSTSISTFFVLYQFMGLAVTDLIRLIVWAFVRTPRVTRILFFAGGGLSLLFTLVSEAIGMYRARRIKTVPYTVRSAKLRRRMRVVLLTDLHIGFFISTKHMRHMVDAVNRMDADMVVISGDIINAGITRECPELDEVAAILSGMKSARGTYAVLGNHDPAADEPAFRDFLKAAHIQLLEDEIYTDDDIQIVGRTTCTKPRKSLSELEDGLDKSRFTMVLDHDPIGMDDAIRAKDDLILCGHTHRGQMFPLNLFVRLIYHRDQLWGKSVHDHTTSIVSAGVGYFSMPMRIGSDSEIVRVELKPEKSSRAA